MLLLIMISQNCQYKINLLREKKEISEKIIKIAGNGTISLSFIFFGFRLSTYKSHIFYFLLASKYDIRCFISNKWKKSWYLYALMFGWILYLFKDINQSKSIIVVSIKEAKISFTINQAIIDLNKDE